MLIVPAIDLCRGQVVRAVAGQRARYRPLGSPLCASADSLELVRSLLALHAFSCIYLADLDAIERTGSNRGSVEELLAAFPGCTFWLDSGFTRPTELVPWNGRPGLRPVLGSESQTSKESFLELLAACAPAPPLLSLDFRGDRFLGPAALLEDRSSWPRELILMALGRVGAGQGPDARLAPRLGLLPGERLCYAAGGVRGAEDVRRLALEGFAGALVSSALHEGRLTAPQLGELAALAPAGSPD